MNVFETSLIPATVSLLKYYQEFGFASFTKNYPYWYFGEVPYKYLIGPITPILINSDLLINNLIYFIPLFILISSIGWGLFFLSFFKEKRIFLFLLPFTIYLLTPFKYLYGFATSDFTSFFAKSLIPFFLILFYKKKYILSVLALVIMLLINTNVLPSVFVFAFCLCVKDLKFRLKKLFSIFLFSICASMLWYGPMYYLRILMNPSIGGRVGFSVIFGVINFFKLILPFVFALLIVKFAINLKRRLPQFIIISLFSFITMSLYRFFANPEFVLDWITWLYELEISIVLLTSYLVNKRNTSYLLILTPLFLITVGLGINLKLGVNHEKAILQRLEEISQGQRVFVSGSTVFSPSKLVQLRGGRDEVIKNKDWLTASYIFRESQDASLITNNLRLLKIKYVLVHTKDSKEYYHDFKNEEIWDKIGVLTYENEGDKIYKID